MRKYFGLLIGRLGPKFHIARSHAKARYYVIERIGRAIEVRRYESRIAAEGSIAAKDAKTGGDEAFRIIADYAAGANQGGTKLSIAFPIETTGRFLVRPVVASAIEVIKMRLFLEPGISLEDAPRPLDPRIRVVPVPEQRVAVIAFRAAWMSPSLHEHEQALSAAVTAAGWKVAGEVAMLFYGVPFATSLPRLTEIAAPVSPRSV